MEIPEWSELDRGGTVTHSLRRSGADMRTRSISEDVFSDMKWVGSVNTCDKVKLCITLFRCLQVEVLDDKSTLKIPTIIRFEK